MLRDGIRDDQWDRIKDLLPGRIGHVGATARNNRLFIDAVLYRLRTGIPWRDLPERFGDFKNIHRRFSRWAEKGLWTNLLSLLTEDADEESTALWFEPINTAVARLDETLRTRRSVARAAG